MAKANYHIVGTIVFGFYIFYFKNLLRYLIELQSLYMC